MKTTTPTLAHNPSRWRKLLVQLESGTGDDMGFIAYTTAMWVMLLMGVILAMVGFWRVGANMASDFGTFQAAVISDATAQDKLQEDLFIGFSSHDQTVNGIPPGAVATDVMTTQQSGRTITGQNRMYANTGFQPSWSQQTDTATFSIGSDTQTRYEKFYAGDADCPNVVSNRVGCTE